MWTLVLHDPQGRELRRLPLRDRSLTIGRGKDRDLVIESKAISRQHAQVESRGGSAILVDLGSANGTLLNGRRIDQPTPLREGDEIRIGDFRLRLQPDPASQAAPVMTDIAAIRIPDRIAATDTASPQAISGGWNSASELLERQLHSIRSFRNEASQEPAQKLRAFEQEWDKAVESMRELQRQLQGDPRVLLFGISRNNREITAKIVDPASRRGHAYLILSPEHPEGKYRDQLTVWLRQFGEADINYDDPREAMRHFVERIARLMA